MGVFEFGTILKIISEIPGIVGKLKLGFGRKGEVNEMREALKKFGRVGHTIKDYTDLLSYSSEINNKTDVIIIIYLPEVNIENKEGSGDSMKKLLVSIYKDLHDFCQKKLFVFFNSSRFIDMEDKGKIKARIDDIKTNLIKGGELLNGEEYDKLENRLRDISEKCIEIASLCNPRIYAIADKLKDYESKFGGI